jgi:hypothetical protein
VTGANLLGKAKTSPDCSAQSMAKAVVFRLRISRAEWLPFGNHVYDPACGYKQMTIL